MNLSLLIRKDGLTTHMTATDATTATQNAMRSEPIATVATVAVATSTMPLTRKQNLIQFVHGCCDGFPVTAQQVIDCFLSVSDEQDIINGGISSEILRLGIELWIQADMPHYSGKLGKISHSCMG